MSKLDTFWLIWLSGFIPLLIGLLCALALQVYSRAKKGPCLSFISTPKAHFLLFIVIAAISIPFTYYVASIARPDGLKLIKYWMKGTPIEIAIWGEVSRYFPLRQTEYYLIYQWASGLNAYFTVSLVQNLLFLSFSLYFLKLLNIRHSVPIIFLYSTASILLIFFSVIYPERNVLLYLVIWGVSVIKWEQTKNWVWFFLAAITTQLALYYKEPAILIFGAYPCVIGVAAILCKGAVRKHHVYLAAIIALICIKWFASFMYFIDCDKMLNHNPKSYATPEADNAPYVFLSYIYHEPVTTCLIFISMTLMLFKLKSLKSVLASTRGRLFYVFGLGGIAYFLVLILFTLSARWYSAITVCAIIFSLLCIEENPSESHIRTRQYFLYAGVILNVIFSAPIITTMIDTRVRVKAIYSIVETQNIQSIHVNRPGAVADIMKGYYKYYDDTITVTAGGVPPQSPDLTIEIDAGFTVNAFQGETIVYKHRDLRQQTYMFLNKNISEGTAKAYLNRATLTKTKIPYIGKLDNLTRSGTRHKQQWQKRQAQNNSN